MSLPNELLPVGLLGTGAVAGAGGYEIERSLRFNSADSAYLSRTPSASGDRKTWTWAGWVKRAKLGSAQVLFSAGDVSSEPNFEVDFGLGGGDSLRIRMTNVSAVQLFQLKTTQVFRDCSAWYHIIVSVDTAQSVASDRVKVYVNGSQVSSFSTETYPTQNLETWINATTYGHAIGRLGEYSGLYLDGYLGDVHFIDGQALAPTSFGEFDANGVWQSIAYTGTYGTNGFHLPFSDNSTAAALGTDASGNGNDWTVNNITTYTPKTLSGVRFDGSGDYLTIPNSADFQFGTGDFTLECFIKTTDGTASLFGLEIGSGSYGLAFSGNLLYWQSSTRATNLFNASATSILDGNWHHVALTRSSGTSKMFFDGVVVGSSSDTTNYNGTSLFNIGYQHIETGYYTGHISNLHVVKGTALYTSNFTPPTGPITSVANTKLLCCKSNSSATAFDVSPGTITANGNVYATTVTDSQPGNDSLVDTPTSYGDDTGAGSEVRGNYATLNPLNKGSNATLTNGNLDYSSSAAYTSAFSTIGITSGKWYFEATAGAFGNDFTLGLSKDLAGSTYVGGTAQSWGYEAALGAKYNNTVYATSGYSSYTTGDVISVAFDADNGKLFFAKNGVWQESGNPVTGANPAYTGLTSGPYFFGCSAGTSGTWLGANFGQRPFAYTAPSGFKALCTTNLPAPVVAKPSEVMDVKLYTGNGSTQTISGLGFSPDLVWVKGRNVAYNHRIFDTVRGTGGLLHTNTTDAEVAQPNVNDNFVSFNSDGFSIGSPIGLNQNSATYVSWCWDAGSSTVTNTQGSITSQVRANATSGFSVVTFTYPSSGSFTVGHGLGVAPSMVIVKHRNRTSAWWVYHASATSKDQYLVLNSTAAVASATGAWGSAAPTSTVFGGTVSTSGVSGDSEVAYCFAPVAGYSAFGSYTGNGSADGSFTYLGFLPKVILIKRTDTTSNWTILDTSREGYNVDNDPLYPNLSNVEGTTDLLDITSNGFKLRTTDASVNASGGTYIYGAWASNPFQYSRAR